MILKLSLKKQRNSFSTSSMFHQQLNLIADVIFVFQVVFEMLNIKVFRIIVEKMKKLSSSVRVTVKSDSSLMLHVEKIDVSVKTYFQDIHLIKQPGKSST